LTTALRILLLRPDPGEDRFGLAPFFRVEPLGLEYLGAALRTAGHDPVAADLRFRPSASVWVRRSRPRLVGISCAHALEFDRVIETAREVRRAAPDAFVLAGGHAAAAFPSALECDAIDAICLDDGEEVIPRVADAVERGTPLSEVPALRYRTGDGWTSSNPLPERTPLSLVPLPARDLFDRHRSGYHCLLFKPVWLVETARGCPHSCNFCSVWQLYGRSFRERPIGAVVEDFASVGDSVFVADDLFWNDAPRSLALAEALRKRGVRKRWILVQTRTDLLARSGELLEAWRPLAEHFDIFLGLEAATDDGLAGLSKGAGVGDSVEAARVARSLKYGINGNFLVDPDWGEEDFRNLWDFVSRNGLQRAGFTIRTPLPGTEYYEEVKGRTAGQPWRRFDMHHLLWEPKLGARRFFELYAETWRRSILNTSGDKRWIDWMRQVRLSQVPYLARILRRTQGMMDPGAYLKEHARLD
jgi:radical SAM superfamily enzyme YgiQ (UPF0313 family)